MVFENVEIMKKCVRKRFMKDKYYEQAVTCVKERVLPVQMELYRACNGDLDRVFGGVMNGNGYFGKVIEPGHQYELGYEKCTCPKVLSGKVIWNRTANLRWRFWKLYCVERSIVGFRSVRIERDQLCRRRNVEIRDY